MLAMALNCAGVNCASIAAKTAFTSASAFSACPSSGRTKDSIVLACSVVMALSDPSRRSMPSINWLDAFNAPVKDVESALLVYVSPGLLVAAAGADCPLLLQPTSIAARPKINPA
jgi:hypothetical protein